MNVQHKNLAAGRWNTLSLIEHMAHIGSEVERSLKWKEKNNPEYSLKAFERALELLDLSLDDPKHKHRFKEFARVREVLVDYFCTSNQFDSSASSLRSYFLHFAYAARRKY